MHACMYVCKFVCMHACMHATVWTIQAKIEPDSTMTIHQAKTT